MQVNNIENTGNPMSILRTIDGVKQCGCTTCTPSVHCGDWILIHDGGKALMVSKCNSKAEQHRTKKSVFIGTKAAVIAEIANLELEVSHYIEKTLN